MLNWPRIGFAWGALALCLSVVLVLAKRLDHRYIVSALALSCGPDPAPSQATNAGFACETFRWGSGDTVSEIDAGLTCTPGFKWYLGQTGNMLGSYSPILPGQVTVQLGGQIVAQTSDVSQHGLWVVNTCGGLASSPTWTVGQFFQHGWYLEFVGEWNATGFAGMPGVAASVQTGFYGYDGYWYPTPGTYYEADNPDMFAFGQMVAIYAGGTMFQNNNSGMAILAPTVEIGTNKWGLLSTPTAATWYAGNNVANLSVIFGVGTELDLYNSKQCLGSEATSQFPLTIDSVKIWQTAGAATPPTGGGGLRFLRY